jgi:hypothetical protein
VIDELASLQKLPQLHTAVTENRKSKNPLVLGFQGKAQLEVIYGHLAEVMLSQPATKIFMKTAEPKAAEWISEAIGKVEIERLKETKFDGSRSGKNFTVDRQIEPLVMGSEISGLDDLHAFLKLGNDVARFDFDYLDLPTPTQGFVPRNSAEGEMSFDPDTLKPRRPKVVVVVKTETETGGAPLAHEITVQQTPQIEPNAPETSPVVIPLDIPDQIMDETTERGFEEERQVELALQTHSDEHVFTNNQAVL